MTDFLEYVAAYRAMPAAERQEALASAMAKTAKMVWVPNVGPQTEAFYCRADETLYGGEAGGGKSDLLLGLALTAHKRALILRRVKEDIEKVGGLGPRLVTILGSAKGYNTQKHVYRDTDREIELNGCEQEKDKERYKGRPHDLKAFDELADFLESQYEFIIGWTRSEDADQVCRVVAATNPPTTPEGQWIVRRWAPWLDPSHPNPAKDGELRWFVKVNGADVEVDGPGPHVIEGRREPVKARSRTFIRSGLSQNPELARTDYAATLENMPEEIRRAYRDGDFSVGLQDDEFQVIPVAWIEAAIQRWKPMAPQGVPMTAMAVDIAQGGPDQTVSAWRHDGWYGLLDVEPGTNTKEGRQVAAMVVKRRRNNCPVIVDVGGGWGGDALVAFGENGIRSVAFNGVQAVTSRTRDGKLKFRNKRAESYWRFREALDPEQEGGSCIALPNDPLMKADLCAVHYQVTIGGILLEEKAAIKDRIGRSPDRGDAVTMCLNDGQKAVEKDARINRRGGHLPQAVIGYAKLKRGQGYGR